MTQKQVKTTFPLPWLLNLFCKKQVLLSFLIQVTLHSPAVLAVNISAVYFSACMRETGVVINVDENKIQLMTLKGEIKNIPRFDIIYIANYPVGHIQIPEVRNPELSDIIQIKTLYQNRVEDLVKGWMIDYSEEQISFLTLSGTQTVIDTADIWDIEVSPLADATRIKKETSDPIEFVHPYPFMHCSIETDGEEAAEKAPHQVFPQYLLSDPLMIKNHLDRLKEGYDRVRKYSRSKRFYPVPQVYLNETSLGIWGNFGSRYGSSKNRSNSFIPAIVSELSDGPFGYQRVFITGAAPMHYSIHEEPQVQAYYRLKASYVHFSIMVDINRFNMGSEKYKWTADEMEKNDNRENEILHLAGGFDYGAWSIDISITNPIYYAVQQGDNFFRNDMELNKGGIFYHNRFFRLELYHGTATDRKEPPIPIPDDAAPWDIAAIQVYNAIQAAKPEFFTDYLFYRLNLELFTFGEIHPIYSLIYRGIDFYREKDGDGLGEFRYKSQSLTNAVYVNYPLGDDLKMSGYLSLEMMDREYGVSKLEEGSSHTYPKGGISLALLF